MAVFGYDVQTLFFYTLLTIGFFNYMIFIWKRRDLFIKSWNCPGPFNLPFIGGAYVVMVQPKNMIYRLVSLHDKYQSSFKFWFGSRLIYFIHEPSQIEALLGISSKNLEKDKHYKYISDITGAGLITAPVPLWKRHRKHIAPTFNLQILNSFVDVFAERSLVLSEILKKNCYKKFDVFHCLSRCTMDIVCETAMNLHIGAQEENSKYAKIFDEILDLTMTRIFLIWNHIEFIWRLLGNKRKLDTRLNTMNDLVDTVIQQKKKELGEGKNNQSSLSISEEGAPKRTVFLNFLLETGELSDKEIRDEIKAFLFAGTDTTAVTLSFLLAVLGMYPDIQQKLYEEVVQVMGKDRMPECNDLPLLVFTERVLKETLRLFPPGSFFLRSITEEVDMATFTLGKITGGKYLLPLNLPCVSGKKAHLLKQQVLSASKLAKCKGDLIIPRGSSAFIFAIYVHRNPKYWPDPLKFDPDRFLPEEVAKRHPCTFIPFSYGPRNCIGMRYAMMAMKTIIAIIIRKFVIHSEYKTIDEIKVKANIALRFQDDPKITIAPRT